MAEQTTSSTMATFDCLIKIKLKTTFPSDWLLILLPFMGHLNIGKIKEYFNAITYSGAIYGHFTQWNKICILNKLILCKLDDSFTSVYSHVRSERECVEWSSIWMLLFIFLTFYWLNVVCFVNIKRPKLTKFRI